MKKIIALLLAVLTVASFVFFAMASSSAEETGTGESGNKEAAQQAEKEEIASCTVEIQSCRLAQDWQGKPVVIVKYSFTNNKEEPQSFMLAFDDAVFQNGIGLNSSYMLDDSANYSSDNQTKQIQKGATLEVEVAYELNDTTTDINVELSALFSFNNNKITKTFSIA